MTASEPYRIILAHRVATELELIFDHVAADSPQGASGLIATILQAIESLRTFPHRTKVAAQAAGSAHPLRSLPVGSYLIYFRVIETDRVVHILDVRHAARRRRKRF